MAPHSSTPLLIENIRSLAAVPPGPLRGSQMDAWPIIDQAALLIEDGRISWFGPASDAPRTEGARRLDAGGGTLIPGLIDCHTHIPFAGDRVHEFVRRIRGETYLAILQSGGGIRVTTRAVRAASLAELMAQNEPRLRRMLVDGVTTVECKSGYGLSPADERKQLCAIADLSARTPLELVPTYMGAHALPVEFEGRPDEFIDAVSEPVFLAQLAGGLAHFCDVFCDRGAFTVEQARRYLTRAQAAGLKLKLHADELAQIGASRLAGELGAVSADHLEHLDDAGIAAMKAAGTVAVVLPGTSFFLGIPHADARRMIAAGLAVAIATDFNPGSCMIESLPFVLNVACCQLRLLPREVLAACTANAAAALALQDRIGSISVGYQADLTILEAGSLDEWLYRPGRHAVRAVIKRGAVVAGPKAE